MSNCNCHTSPNRDGSGRLQRYLTALDPAYAKIDGRNIEDLLVFVRKYANQVRFFDIPGSSGDHTPDDITQLSWSEFFRRDLAVTAASIMLTDVTAFKTEYEENRAELEMAPTAHHFGNLFDPILGMAAKMDSWLSLAIPGYPLHTDLLRIIQSGLKPAMKKILAYEEAYRLIDAKHPLKLDYTPIQNDSAWGLTDEPIPDASIYTGFSLEEKMLNAMLYVDDVFNTFYGIMSSLTANGEKYLDLALKQYPRHQPHMTLFIAFLRLFSIVQEQMNGITERMLNFYYRDVLHLEEKPSIPDRVHIVFELAKEVFQYDVAAGTSLNGGVDKSNNKQVYKTNTDLVVNQAKVKELKTIFIQKGETGDPGTRTMVPSINAFYARPIANSADGFGEKITDPGGKWSTFGKGTPLPKEKFNLNNPCTLIEQAKELASRKDQAQIGFAISSPQLLLQGGKRIIRLHIDNLTDLVGNITVDEANPESHFHIYLSGEKGWIDAGKLMKKTDFDELALLLKARAINPTVQITEPVHYIDRENSLIFIFLPISAEPVVKYDAAIHTGYNIQAKHPVLRIMLNTEKKLGEATYKEIKFSNIRIETQVGSMFPDADILKEMAAEANAKELAASIENPDNYGWLFFDGLRTVVLQNDETLLTPGKPFDPFTAYPLPGKSFYIGSEEIFNKPLGRMGVNLLKTQDEVIFLDTWALIRTNDQNPAADDPNYAVSILEDRTWFELTPYGDFNGKFSQLALTHNILYKRIPLDIKTKMNKMSMASMVNLKDPIPHTHPRLPVENKITQWSQGSNKGFLRITNLRQITKGNLSTMQQSQEMAAEMQVKEIAVSYYSDLSPLEAGTDQFFHIYPFGAAETYINPALQEAAGVNVPGEVVVTNPYIPVRNTAFEKADKAAGYLLVQAGNRLLPQFTWESNYARYNQRAVQQPQEGMVTANAGGAKEVTANNRYDMANIIASASGMRSFKPGNNQYTGKIQEEGMLFIGLEKLEPLQTVSMLFQFADGSAEDEDQDPPEIHWSYLTNNEWRPMNGENIVSDGTYGFQTTGIIKFDVPADVTTNNTIITSGLVWFMASVTKNANRIPMLVDVVTQAVEATFEDNGNDQSHFDEALPAGTIGKLSVAVAEVSKVSQPFASFDGKHKETGKEYYVRVSERLRHKGRAINAWDYEHLVLDRFPSIYKVKALNHLDPECLCRNTTATATLPAPPAEENNNPIITKLEGAYSSDGFIDDADTQALKDVMGKINVANVTAAEVFVNTITPSEIAMAEKVGGKIKEFMVSSGIKANVVNVTTANGGKRTYGITITEKKTAKAADGVQTIATYTLAYARTGLDAASLAKVKEAALKTKSDAQFFATTTLFYQKPEEQLIAENLLKEIDSEFSKAGLPAKQYKLAAVTGSSGTGLITITAPVAVPVPVPVSRNICCGPQMAPGHVLIVPVSNLKNRNAVNPLQPKTARRTLLEIEAYLQKRTSPFVKVHAKNPVYEQVITVFRVKFHTGTDKGYYLKKLNEEIVHFLTPWAFDETADVIFGGEIYASSIINFIEERPYVDFITDFYMLTCVDACCPPVEVKKEKDPYKEEQTPAELFSQFCNCKSFEELLQSGFDGLVVARPTTARSILVSVPQHIIIPYEEPQRESDCEKRKKQKALAPVKGEAPAEEAPKPVDVKPAQPAPVTPAPAKPVARPVVAPVMEKEQPKDGRESLEKKTTTPAKPAPAKPAAAKAAVAKKAAPKPGKKPNK